MLKDYLGEWPGIERVFRITRTRKIGEQKSVETVHGITSLTRDKADAKQLLAIQRAHWGIENSIFYVRDFSMGEDQCRVRTGSAPQALAALRNAVITLLRRAGFVNIKATIEHLGEHREEGVILLHCGRT